MEFRGLYTLNKKALLCLITILTIVHLLFAEIPKGYVTLDTLQKETQSTLYWDSITDTGILEKNGHQLIFTTNSQIALLDYSKLTLIDSLYNENGTWYVSQNFIENANQLFNSVPPENHFRIGAILIDAGHGGKDPGAVETVTIGGKKVTLQEKDMTLTVAKDLHNKLSRVYPDKKILLTRDTDTYLSLSERVEIANNVSLAENEAILYVSIHVNAAFDKNAKGFEVWYLSPGARRNVLSESSADEELLPILNSMLEEEFTTESILIAKYILDGLNTEIGENSPSRGLKAEEWFVVKNAKMPSVLVEMGFITNPSESLLLNDASYLRKVSLGIYNGLISFVTHFERSRGFTSSQ